jgi:Lar family restriction alleviation protein
VRREKVKEIETLRKCPFCGGNADLFTKQVYNGDIIFAACKVCDAKSRAFFIDNFEGDWWARSPAQSAVEAWNRRAQNV